MLSRKPQKAVHSTDPGQSGLWLLLTFGGGVAGASIPYFATHSAAWTTGGGTIGAAVGATAAAIPQFRDWVSTRSRRRQIAESAGAATNINREPLESLRVHNSDRDVTEFVPRDIQDQLVKHLNNGTPVLIEGPSMSGKTRLAIETIRSHWPEAPFWFPRDEGDIEKLLNSSQQPAPGTVILLDDIDRFLSNQSFTLGRLNQWINIPCAIIATMMHSQYVKHSDRANEKVPGWDAVNRFKILTLDPSLSTEELNAVKLTSYANQLSQIESIGLGPLLGCAEAVRIAFADELEKHSWSGALIKAAADWRRIDLGPASREQLISFSLAHKSDAWETAETVNLDNAWEQATKLINHTISLLRRVGEDRWEVLDIIADEADWKISADTFAALQNVTLSERQIRRSAITMFLQGSPPSSTNAMFQRAIDTDPTNATILGAYALFLENVRGEMDQAEQMYQRAIDADPNSAFALASYAVFLENVRGEMDQAQDMYQRAIDADPNGTFALASYAVFLENVRGNMDQAQDMYQRAITADPTNATNLGAYALFLHTKRGNIDQADQMYQRVIDADPTNATNLGAYALFLHTKRGEMDQAEQMYQRAIDADPNSAFALASYAVFLENVRGNMDQAQDMYQRAITADPTNATNLGAYALFLHTKRGEMDQAQDMYQRAIDADPNGTFALASYAVFLENVRGNMDQAQDMYQRAITADPTNVTTLGVYALFLHTVRGDADQAEQMYQRAIDANPYDAVSLGNYAQILFAKSDDMKAISLAEKAISLASDEEKPLRAECHFYLFAHSSKHRKKSGRALKSLLAEGVTTGDWSFEMNLERLRREADPRLELLEAAARTLGDGDTSRLDAFEEWRDL